MVMSRVQCFTLVASAVACLGGCASYKPAPISPAQNAAAIEARSLEDSRLQSFVVAVSQANGFADRTSHPRARPSWGLTNLTLAAVYYHPSLDIARAKLAEAQAAVVTARQIPNPSLSFEELSYNLSVPTPSPWTIAPIINFLIETAGKREYRTGQARALVDAARADLATASWQVRKGVRDALLSLWAARGRVALLRQRLDLQSQLVALLEEQFSAGQASSLDVARERISRNQITLAIGDAELQTADALTQLAAAIGVTRQAVESAALSFQAFEQPQRFGRNVRVGELRREALFNRSDIQGLLAQYASAESALQLQIANQYPNLTLSPGYSYSQGQNLFLLLPAVDLPIFNQNQGPIAAAVARRQEAAARFTSLQTQVIDAIDGSFASYHAAAQATATADGLLSNEQVRERDVSRMFTAGQINRSGLLTARIERILAQESQFNAMVRERQALGALEDAVQRQLFGKQLAIPALEHSPRRHSVGPS